MLCMEKIKTKEISSKLFPRVKTEQLDFTGTENEEKHVSKILIFVDIQLHRSKNWLKAILIKINSEMREGQKQSWNGI